jgi:hypothetical protein
MGFKVLGQRDQRWEPRKGLEGPFQFLNGQVLYYDPRDGQYWDPTTDFYLDNAEVARLHQNLVDFLAKGAIL